MVLDKQDVRAMQKQGAKVSGNGKEVKSDTDYLREISLKLSILINRPQESKEIVLPKDSPQITVQPPEVTVNVPEQSRPKQWRFNLSKNDKGQTTEIIATAIE